MLSRRNTKGTHPSDRAIAQWQEIAIGSPLENGRSNLEGEKCAAKTRSTSSRDQQPSTPGAQSDQEPEGPREAGTPSNRNETRRGRQQGGEDLQKIRNQRTGCGVEKGFLENVERNDGDPQPQNIARSDPPGRVLWRFGCNRF